MRIEASLRRWQKAGLIGETDVAKILAYEASKQGFRFSTALLGLGALAILLGIAAIISSNWDVIPASLKLVCHGLINLGLGGGIVYAMRKGSTVWREIFLFILGGSTLTFIALIGQIYQTGAPLWQALTLWLVLVTPFLFVLSRSRFVYVGWFIGFVVTLWELIEPVHDLLKGVRLDVAVYTLVPFVLIGATQSVRLRSKWTGWATFLSATGYAGVTVAASLAQLAWPMGGPHWAGSQESYAVGFLVGLAAVGTLWVLRRAKVLVEKDALIDVFAALSVLAVFLPLLADAVWCPSNVCHRPYIFSRYDEGLGLIGAAIFMLYWAFVGWTALRFDRRGLLNFATVVIALRLVIVYIEVFGDLLSTGIGLIISGILLIALVMATQKLMRRFNSLARPQ